MRNIYIFRFFTVMFFFLNNINAFGQEEHETPLAKTMTTSDIPLAIINNPGYQNIVLGNEFVHKLELVNPTNKQLFWAFDGQVPHGFTIQQDGSIKCRVTNNSLLQNHISLNTEYEIRFVARNISNPEDKVTESFKVKFFRSEPEKPILNLVQTNYTINEGTLLKIRVDCGLSSLPITLSNTTPPPNGTLKKSVADCGDEFEWIPDFNFVTDKDNGKKNFVLKFIAINSLHEKVETDITVTVLNTIDCKTVTADYDNLKESIESYHNQLISSFINKHKELEKNKRKNIRLDYASIALGLVGGAFALLPNNAQHNGAAILSFTSSGILGFKQIGKDRDEESTEAIKILASSKALESALIEYRITNCNNSNTEVNLKNLESVFSKVREDMKNINLITMNSQDINTYLEKNKKKIHKKFGHNPQFIQ